MHYLVCFKISDFLPKFTFNVADTGLYVQCVYVCLCLHAHIKIQLQLKYTASDNNQQAADYWSDLIIVALIQKRPDRDSSFFGVYVNSCSPSLCLYTSVCLRPFCVYSNGQKGKLGKEVLFRSKSLKNDILDRPLVCVIFLKLMRVDSIFFPHVFLGIGLLPSLSSNLPDLVSLTSLIPLRPGGGSCWSAPLPPSEKHLGNIG